jgi:regulator of replication initiation timing
MSFLLTITPFLNYYTKNSLFLLQLDKSNLGYKMFEAPKEEITVNKLSQKIDDLLARFEAMKSENDKLRQELVTLKAQSESKNIQISKLEEDLMSRDIESDDIFSKIEEVLKR